MSDIYLYVYDLTKGMARQFSPMFLGKQIDGVWHTGIVAFDTEWYFGNDGISSCPPKGTPLGDPNEIVYLGKIELSYDDFEEVIRQFSETTFKIGSYNLIEHNCNNFSNELSQILVGKPIPSHILDLPREILNSPIGPMLKPFLEQAADPMHMHKTGQASQFMSGAKKAAASATTPSSSTKQPADAPIPASVDQFKPEVKSQLSPLVDYCESKNMLSVNEHNLLVDTKDYFNQAEIKWSIAKNHIKLLLTIYLNKLDASKPETAVHRLAVLNMLQLIALTRELASSLLNDELFHAKFLPSVKELVSSSATPPDLKFAAFRLLSNICVHSSLSQAMLSKHQDFVCKELVDFILIEAETDIDTLIHEASISFFYNLIPAYHLEPSFRDTNALAMGVALLERLPKFKSNQRTTYKMLSLLRSCLVRSHDVVDLAQSMEFDLGSYQAVASGEKKAAEAATSSSNEINNNNSDASYDTLVHNIDELIHEHKDQK